MSQSNTVEVLRYQSGYSYAEKKRVRKNLTKGIEQFSHMPYLLDVQKESYEKFLQMGVPVKDLKQQGLHAVLSSEFPITSFSGHINLEYLSYALGKPNFSVNECKRRGVTYSVSLRVRLRLVIYNRESAQSSVRTVKDIREQKVYLGEMPLMTDAASFVINGIDRVVVLQLHRSPSLFIEHDSGKTHILGRLLYSARVIPARGAWLDFEFDTKDCLFMRIDRRRKLPATIILRALNFSTEEILELFYEQNTFNVKQGKITLDLVAERLRGEVAPCDICDSYEQILVKEGRHITGVHVKKIKKAGIKLLEVPEFYLIGAVIAAPIVDKESGEVIVETNQEITQEVLDILLNKKVKQFRTLHINDLDSGSYISDTLRLDSVCNRFEALVEIYRVMRPGEPPTKDSAENLFRNLFFAETHYDLSEVGRMKFNYRLNRKDLTGMSVLSKEDIVDVIKLLINVRNGLDESDDIDSLANRRVRSVGEMVENQFRIGLTRVERSVKDRLNLVDTETLMPQDLMNSKPITAILKEFFGSGQLSQFMDQNNPIARLTHIRRVSALGPGGLIRERSGFEVRDIHPTHFGRLCAIESPEGPNIGLINSLALYARVNKYGFLETPCFKVVKGTVTDECVYISAIEEGSYHIAQANVPRDNLNKLQGDMIACRYGGEAAVATVDKIDYVDISPRQFVSINTSTIPFIEHDDANRALMGANMQRQAVPTLRATTPLVGTGLERIIAIDSGSVVIAKRSGIIDFIDAERIVIRVNQEGEQEGAVDIYDLIKYARSNQNTCINQKPIVKQGDKVLVGDILADGSSIDLGELALGKNLLVAFMSCRGFNFEDSILISERLVSDDVLTSIHIQELSCVARDTKLGSEEITVDISSVGESALSKLDDSGIIYVGAEVKSNDILVGKVTPKSEVRLSPEEKLLHAIFGEKASDVKDTSLRVPLGVTGTVIDVQIFNREGVGQDDERTKAIKEVALEKVRKNLYDEERIRKESVYNLMKEFLIGLNIKSAPDLEADTCITGSYLEKITPKKWEKIVLADQNGKKAFQKYLLDLKKIEANYKDQLEEKTKVIQQSDELSPGIIKVVKVSLAVKRRIQPGDKLAGRHGNKGVISVVIPEEDMPYQEDGTPVDLVLNPLSVPSRMNIGQILEIHLGWAVKGLGKKIDHLIEQKREVSEIRFLLDKIYKTGSKEGIDLKQFTDEECLELAENLRRGVPIASPVFDGVSEENIKELLKLADLPETGQAYLYDGLTGERFDRPITIGYMYILKLNHLVDDKMHARSTGSYSLVTQQPLGGKAQFGGQRFGEMEVWALEAYGAAYTLQEILTVKSDDVVGRTNMYKSIVDGKHVMNPNIPEAFNVLLKEMLSLAIRMEVAYID